MATTSTVTAVLSSDIGFAFVDSTAGYSTNESASLGYSLALGAGSGTGEINAAVRFTGHLPSGGTTDLDFTAFPKPILGGVYSVNFTDVKGVVVENQWNGPGEIGAQFAITLDTEVAYLDIAAPSISGITGLFNGSSALTRIAPQSTWLYNNRLGMAPGATNKILSLVDTTGSGVPVSLIVVGVTG